MFAGLCDGIGGILQAAASPQEAAEWLPEAWTAAAESLRSNSVRVCACVVGGPDEEGAPGAYALDAGFARAYAALAAVTGGLVRTYTSAALPCDCVSSSCVCGKVG